MTPRRLLSVSLSGAALLTPAARAQDAPAQDLLVRCRTLVVAPDTVLSPGELLVRDGKVAHVGAEIPADARARARVLAFADATVVPGFVLPYSALGQEADLAERATAFTPALPAAEAFDPFGDELAALARRAVTSCALGPSPRNVAGGIAALVKPGPGRGAIAVPQTYLNLSLNGSARSPERPPTSLIGAIDLLRTAFTDAKNGVRGGADLAVIGQALRGERRIVLHADTSAELIAALELAHEFGLQPALLGARAADECVDRIAAAHAAVILDALRPELGNEQLHLPARLEAAGVPFAFAGAAEQLRVSAALAVRWGASRKAALAALTRVPAELVGAAERVGSLRRGCDADFAVFAGDPIDLASALRAVYVGGVRVHGAEPGPAAPELAAVQEDR
jgi:imidazolonepropionase-like amidohydrolase